MGGHFSEPGHLTHGALPPSLVRARRRVAWGKTLALMALFGVIMGAHVWWVWDPGAVGQRFMVGVPIVLYGLAEVFILGARLREIPAYRQQLRASLAAYPEREALPEGEARRSYEGALAELTARQRAEISSRRQAYKEAKSEAKSGAVWLFGAATLLMGNFALCKVGAAASSVGAVLGLTFVVLGLVCFLLLLSLGQRVSDLLDERIMLGHIAREQYALRDLRREAAPEELTGALSEAAQAEHRGALSPIEAPEGALSPTGDGDE